MPHSSIGVFSPIDGGKSGRSTTYDNLVQLQGFSKWKVLRLHCLFDGTWHSQNMTYLFLFLFPSDFVYKISQKSLGLRSGVDKVGTRVQDILSKPHRRYERVCKSAETAKVFARAAQSYRISK